MVLGGVLMNIKYLGHSAFLLEDPNANILIDPFIKDNPKCPIHISDLPKINYILVTHGHGDHLGDTVEIARKFNSLVICNFEISLYLSKYNIKTHALHIGGSFNFPFGKVKMTNAVHGSSILEGPHVICGGNPGGFLITLDDKKLYHSGDTGLTMDMKLLECESIDLAMLPIGGNFTMDIDDALRAIDFIKPKSVIPMHYDTFPLIESNPELLKLKSSCEVLNISPGDYISL